MKRREFLQNTLAAGAAISLGGFAARAQETKAEPVFKDMPLTDQYGQAFTPPADKPYIVVFGYGGCPLCEKISATVVATQKKLLEQKKDVQIIVVSMQPEQDRFDANKKDEKGKAEENPALSYMKKYYELGIRQQASESAPEEKDEKARIALYEAAAKIPAKDRLFHIVCPKTAKDSIELERRVAAAVKKSNDSTMILYDKSDAKAHAVYLTMFNKDKVVGKPQPGIDLKTMEAPAELTKKVAEAFLQQVNALEEAKKKEGRSK